MQRVCFDFDARLQILKPCSELEPDVIGLGRRERLQREGSGPVAAAEDGLELQSRVQLLDGPFYEGQYMIGSVNFVRAPSADTEGSPQPSGSKARDALINGP